MDSEDSIRQKKQHFLYTQIIESGYDPTDFKEFLDNKKENGSFNNKFKVHQLKIYNLRQKKKKKKKISQKF